MYTVRLFILSSNRSIRAAAYFIVPCFKDIRLQTDPFVTVFSFKILLD